MIHEAKKCLLSLFFIFIILFGATQAQENSAKASEFELTIDNIMKGPELIGTAPSSVMWSVDGKKLYFRWQKPGDKSSAFFAISPPDLKPQKITPEELLKVLPIPSRSSSYSRYFRSGFPGMEVRFDKEKKRALLIRDGDISLLDIPTGKLTQLTSTDERESNANFTFDQKKISFTYQDNLFLLNLQDRCLHQMTSFSKRTPPLDKKPDEIERWYQDQQKELFQEFSKPRRRLGQKCRRPW